MMVNGFILWQNDGNIKTIVEERARLDKMRSFLENAICTMPLPEGAAAQSALVVIDQGALEIKCPNKL